MIVRSYKIEENKYLVVVSKINARKNFFSNQLGRFKRATIENIYQASDAAQLLKSFDGSIGSYKKVYPPYAADEGPEDKIPGTNYAQNPCYYPRAPYDKRFYEKFPALCPLQREAVVDMHKMDKNENGEIKKDEDLEVKSVV